MERPAEQALTPAGAARMYQRFLAVWAMDALRLRRAGLDTPSVRTGLRSLEDPRDGSAPGRAVAVEGRRTSAGRGGAPVGV